MADRILTRRALNRALLARQLFLERASISVAEAVERVGGLQTQYAPSGYVGLWSRLAGFKRGDLTAALEDRSVVQATLMRVTIHVVSRREYWKYALGVRQARRAMAIRNLPRVTGKTERDLVAAAVRIQEALADGPRSIKELGDLGTGFVGNLGLWVDLVRVPPSGTWERRRADRLALAEAWVGPCDASEEDGLRHLVSGYLRAFGPASWRDVASWAGIPINVAKRAGSELTLVRYRDEDGGDIVDLPGAPLPDPATPAPVRFLPHWDANLLVHARRTGLLPEAYRARVFSIRNPFSVGTYLIDGVVAGAWSVKDGRIELDPYEELSAADRKAVESEREALEAFHS
jgi:winged helix DNA-binding protein